MTLNQVIKAANRHYPDGLLDACWDYANERPRTASKAGDTLALFIVRELRDVYNPEASTEEQIKEAHRAMECAAEELHEVARGLREVYDLYADDGGW